MEILCDTCETKPKCEAHNKEALKANLPIVEPRQDGTCIFYSKIFDICDNCIHKTKCYNEKKYYKSDNRNCSFFIKK